VPPLIDTHSHLDEITNVGAAIAQARAAGVAGILAVGSCYESNQKVLRLARDHAGFVYPALGLHPWNLGSEDLGQNLEFIEARMDEAVAIGEVGLDYDKRVRVRVDKDQQANALRQLLGLAKRYDKPAVIHSRYAWRDAFNLVREAGLDRVVFHWFTGPSSVLRDITGNGYYLSATPAVEYHEEHRRAVKEAPLERLLLETDSPVVYRRGTEFEYESRPVHVLRTLAGVSKLRSLDEAVVAEATTRNAMRFFGFQHASGSRQRHSVLIIAQSALTRSLIGSQLQEEGFRVVGAADLSKAMSQSKDPSLRPDLIVIDIQGEDFGNEVVGQLGSSFVGVSLLLVHGSSDYPAHITWPAAVFSLLKPASVGRIVARVKELVSH
jgi:TatD DNase family protein